RHDHVLGNVERAADEFNALEKGVWLVDILQHGLVVSQYLAPWPQGDEIQAAVERITHGIQLRRRQAALLLQAARQLGVRQRGHQYHHAHRDAGRLDAFDHVLGDAILLGIKTDNEPRGDEHAGPVDSVHALGKAAPGVLLLLGGNEGFGIRAFDTDEQGEEVRLPHHLQELRVIRQIHRRFGRELEGIIPLFLPAVQFGQESLECLLVPDQVVVDEVDMAAVTHPVQRVEFGEHLLVGLCPRDPPIKLDNVAEFAVERTAARELNADINVMLALEQVETRDRALADIDLELFPLEHAFFGTGGPRRDELIDDSFSLAEDKKIRLTIDLRAGCGGRTADDHRLAAGMAKLDHHKRVRLLREHDAGHHHVGPVDIGLAQLLGVAIDQPNIPSRWQQCRHGNQAERRRGTAYTGDVADLLKVPE